MLSSILVHINISSSKIFCLDTEDTKDPNHSVADKSAAEGTSSTNNPVDMSLVWFTHAIEHQQHKILYTFSMSMF